MKKTHQIKVKKVFYENKKVYCLNTYDDEELNGFSEFPIGSITKVFTAISLLILHQTKKINIFENIGKYMENEQIKHLMIFDIMNHISGLKSAPDKTVYGEQQTAFQTATEVYEKYKNFDLVDIKLMTREYSYSNFGYIILGALIEKVTGKHWYDFVTEKILKPLKMNKTGTEETNITLYDSETHKELTQPEKNERTIACSAGQLKSCVSDLTKFAKFPSLLNKKTLEILQDLYFYISKDENTIIIQHNGGIGGGASSFTAIYDKNYEVKDILISFYTGDGKLMDTRIEDHHKTYVKERMKSFEPLLPTIREFHGHPVSFPRLFFNAENTLLDYTQIPLPAEKTPYVLGNLFLGSVRAARNKQWLEDNKIDFVISVIDKEKIKDVPVVFQVSRPDSWLHIDIIDEYKGIIPPLELGALRNTVKILHEKLSSRKNVLVHCRSGVSRSVTIVVAFLMTYFGYPRDPAIRYIQSFRYTACPAFPFYLLLGHLEEELKSERK